MRAGGRTTGTILRRGRRLVVAAVLSAAGACSIYESDSPEPAKERQATVLFTVPAGGSAVGVVLRAGTNDDLTQPCFLVDDAVLRPAE